MTEWHTIQTDGKIHIAVHAKHQPFYLSFSIFWQTEQETFDFIFTKYAQELSPVSDGSGGLIGEVESAQ